MKTNETIRVIIVEDADSTPGIPMPTHVGVSQQVLGYVGDRLWIIANVYSDGDHQIVYSGKKLREKNEPLWAELMSDVEDYIGMLVL